MENREFLFINRSAKERYIDWQIFERGHYRRLFYLLDERMPQPELADLLETDIRLLWNGNPNDVHAPEFVKSFVRLKHDLHVEEEQEGRNGCIWISVVVAALGLLIYWIFW